MLKEILAALRLLLVMTIALGIIYPAVMTCFAQAVFADKANGSMVYQDSKIVGSKLIGQSFSQKYYFHGRPSAASAAGYDAANSGGSNLAPTSKALLTAIEERAQAVRSINILPADSKLPSDLVTASGSGLDPHISPAAAALQIPRVAKERGASANEIEKLVNDYTEKSQWGFLGEDRVNVLLLNLALDEKYN